MVRFHDVSGRMLKPRTIEMGVIPRVGETVVLPTPHATHTFFEVTEVIFTPDENRDLLQVVLRETGSSEVPLSALIAI